MADDIYTVTIKYELRHTRGELVPSIDEVRETLEKRVKVGDELHVHVERKVDEPVTDPFTDDTETITKTKIEGCRVAVDEVEVQEARRRR